MKYSLNNPSTLNNEKSNPKISGADNVISELSVLAINLAVTEYIKKVTHEATLVGLQEATDKKQSKLPLHVEYDHLSKNLNSKKKNNKIMFNQKVKNYYPPKIDLKEIKEKNLVISTKYTVT